MADIVVTLTATLEGSDLDREYQEVVHVPPGYTPNDTRMLFAVAVENIGWHALDVADLPHPIRDALLGNDAKLVRLEALVRILARDWDETIPRSVLDELREISLVDAREAFERWGQPDSEGSEQDD